MNRDYSYSGPSVPSFVHVSPETPEIIDYLLPTCALCFKSGEVAVVRLDGLITYAHDGCATRWLDMN